MSALAVGRAVPTRAVRFTGVGTLLRSALRRDRRRLLIWVLALGGTVVYATSALGAVYPTAADRQARAAVMQTPAGILLSGPGFGVHDYTLGSMTANELGLSVMIAIAIMSIQFVVRHTRAEEEDGAAELVLAGVVGRRAPLTTALAVTVLADLAIVVVITAGLVAGGLAPVDSVALAVGWGLTGLVFGGVAAVTAQVFVQARSATGAALAVLGAAALVRGVGDVLRPNGSVLSWFSPIAWAQQTRAFVDLRWTPLLLSVALIGGLVAGAYRLNRMRDIGAGLLAARRGPATAAPALSGPLPLLARLQRGTVLGWTVALLLLGITFGSLTDSVRTMVRTNPVLARLFGATGARITDSFTAATAVEFALCAAAFAVASVLRLRAEEAAGRTELVLAYPVHRGRWLGSGLVVTALGAALLLGAAGLGDGLTAAAVSGDAGLIGRDLGAALVHLPAVLVVAGIAALLVAAAPRLAALAWLVVVWALVAGVFGTLLHLPSWALKLSPLGWTPKVPAEAVSVSSPAGLVLVALALMLAALAVFRARDVPA